MKKRVFQYTIAEPCHESWAAMTPNEKGRFCNSCAKPVVDFTKMTDRQVVQFMTTATGSVCGRMHTQQLNRDFTLIEQGRQPFFSLRAVLLGTALSTFSALTASAQGRVTPIKGEVVAQPIDTTTPPEPFLMGDIAIENPVCAPKDSVFSGKVVSYMIDSHIGGVQVTLFDEDGTEIATTLSNDDGRFFIPLTKEMKPFRAVFMKEEYFEEVYYFADLLITRDLTVGMSHEREIMMGMIVAPRPVEELNIPEEPKEKE